MEVEATQIPFLLDQIIASIPVFKPEFALVFAFLGSILSSLFVDRYWKYSSFCIAVSGVLLSTYFVVGQFGAVQSGFFGMLHIDSLSVYARLIVLAALLISLLLIQQYIKDDGYKRSGDIYSILLAAAVGMNLLTISSNWLMAFIAIETVSISSYILVGYFSQTKIQSEAAMKYALFGSVSAAAMLYGLSLIYGFTGNLDFSSQEHIQGLITAPKVMCSIAILFVFIGIGFKLGFVPFHLWTPDVYEGAPTPITAFLSTVPKVAALILFLRLFQSWSATLFYFSELTLIFLITVAIVTMLVGNLIALRQTNVKRMMAYSSIGHTGFLLMAILNSSTADHKTLLFYIAAYTIMNLGVFACIQVWEKLSGSSELKSYTGQGASQPILFTMFTVLGISLIGLPPTAGFVGKLLVFTSTFELYQNTKDLPILLLLITGALTSVISLFYYFKIPLYAFLRKGNGSNKFDLQISVVYVIAIVLGISAFVLGIFPQLLLSLFN